MKGDADADETGAVTRRVEFEEEIAAAPLAAALDEGLVLAPWISAWRRGAGRDPGSLALLDALAPWQDRRLGCFGAFENERTTARLNLARRLEPIALELDRTLFPGGRVDYEIEVELPPDTPVAVAEATRGALETWLAEHDIAAATASSKLARFRAALDADRS